MISLSLLLKEDTTRNLHKKNTLLFWVISLDSVEEVAQRYENLFRVILKKQW